METAHCRSCSCKAFSAQFWKDSKCKDCFHNILDHAKDHQRHSVEKEGTAGGIAHEFAATEETPLKEKRDYIVKEILTTERAYVENIAYMVAVFMRALKAIPENVLSSSQISPIFSNAEEIFPLNSQLLRDLEDRWSEWSSTQAIGDVFVKIIPFFQTYTNYTSGYSLGLAALKECEKNSVFQGVVARCASEYKLGLESLMIQPVQRIPRYTLLLADLLKSTDPSHPDYPNLKICTEKMLQIANNINEAIRISENRKKVLDIQNSILPSNTVSLVAPHRMYVRQGVLTKICRKSNKRFTFFLFSDMLLYADQLPADRFLFHRKFSLDTCRFEDNGPSNVPFSFVIANAQKSFAVFADSQESKDEWLSDLNTQTRQLFLRRDSFKHKQPFEATFDGLNVSVEAPVWAPDDSAPACLMCNSEFNFFNRRHHCRACGRVVCGKCSDKKLRITSLDSKHDVRVCTVCYAKRKDTLRQSDAPLDGSESPQIVSPRNSIEESPRLSPVVEPAHDARPARDAGHAHDEGKLPPLSPPPEVPPRNYPRPRHSAEAPPPVNML